jgi:hypothetical protein
MSWKHEIQLRDLDGEQAKAYRVGACLPHTAHHSDDRYESLRGRCATLRCPLSLQGASARLKDSRTHFATPGPPYGVLGVRNAISIGGDSDTIGCITGGIAEVIFGVPEEIGDRSRGYLSDDLIEVVDRFYEVAHL